MAHLDGKQEYGSGFVSLQKGYYGGIDEINSYKKKKKKAYIQFSWNKKFARSKRVCEVVFIIHDGSW